MIGMGEQSLPAFAVALGLSSAGAGLAASVPMVVGAVLQVFLVPLATRVRSLQRWVVLCCALQAASFVPLVAGAWHGSMGVVAFGVAAATYWTLGLAAGPAWSTWVEPLVPKRVAFRFWSRRARWLHVFTILGLLAAGAILQAGGGDGSTIGAFASVFFAAACARVVSVLCIARQSEHEPHPRAMRVVSWRELLARFRGSEHARDARSLIAILSGQLALQFALPFFVPYAVATAGCTYGETMALLAAAVLGRFVALPAWGRFASRRSLGALLLVGGAASVPVSVLWLIAPSYGWLLVVQLFAGVAWGAAELATFLLLFDHVHRDERLSVLMWHNLANALCLAAGASSAGALLAAMDGTRTAFAVVFGLAALLRAASLVPCARVARGERVPSPGPPGTRAAGAA